MPTMPHLKTQHGISLIESLVAIVVMALGILGVIGVQLRTLSDTQTSVRRAQAVLLIEDLSERMKVNPNALNNLTSYESDFDDVLNFVEDTCRKNNCTPTQQASYDLAMWKNTVANALPLGKASIFIPPAEQALTTGQRQLGIMISWRQNERSDADSAFKDNTDSTKVLVDGQWKSGAGDTVCPDDRTCHLQYIPVSARCAPYDNGSDTPTFYCS